MLECITNKFFRNEAKERLNNIKGAAIVKIYAATKNKELLSEKIDVINNYPRNIFNKKVTAAEVLGYGLLEEKHEEGLKYITQDNNFNLPRFILNAGNEEVAKAYPNSILKPLGVRQKAVLKNFERNHKMYANMF
jgi:hypothetical protein